MHEYYDELHLDQYLPILEKEKILFRSHECVKIVRQHDHCFLELTYVLSGEAEHTLDGQTVRIGRGDYLIVDYGSRHSYRALSPRGFDNLDCLFLPELLDPVLKGTKSLRSLLEHYLLHINPQVLVQNPARMVFHDRDGRIMELLSRMSREAERKEAAYMEFLRCYLIEILLLTVRGMEGAQAAAAGQDISAFLTAYVAEHYMEPLTLQNLADKLNYSLPYVSKRFKDEIGVSFVHYLQNYRVMQGCRLITNTNRSFSEIAELVGYKDVKFFSELVKKITGLSPGDFRRHYKK